MENSKKVIVKGYPVRTVGKVNEALCSAKNDIDSVFKCWQSGLIAHPECLARMSNIIHDTHQDLIGDY